MPTYDWYPAESETSCAPTSSDPIEVTMELGPSYPAYVDGNLVYKRDPRLSSKTKQDLLDQLMKIHPREKAEAALPALVEMIVQSHQKIQSDIDSGRAVPGQRYRGEGKIVL